MTVYRYPRGASIGISLDFTATGSETIDQATVTAALRLAGSDMPVAQFSIERRGGKGWILRLSRDVTSVLDRGHYLADIQTTVDGAVTASIVEIEIVRGSASGMQIGEAFITSQDGDTDLDNTHLRARSLKIASGGGVSDYEDDSDIAFAVVGDDDKILYHVMKDRELRAGAISAERTVAFGGYQLEEYEDDGSNGPLVIVGVDGKIIPGLGGDDASAELVAARGSRDSLDARLSTALTTYGAPRQAIHGEWLLRETRHAIGMIEAGYTYQLPMLWIGDSWTDNERYWLEPLTDQLIAQFGDGGAGFTGLAWNAAQGQTTAQAHKNARSEVTVAYTAGITPVWNGTPTPDMRYVTVPAGEKLTIAIPAGNSSATVFSSAIPAHLHAIAGMAVRGPRSTFLAVDC